MPATCVNLWRVMAFSSCFQQCLSLRFQFLNPCLGTYNFACAFDNSRYGQQTPDIEASHQMLLGHCVPLQCNFLQETVSWQLKHTRNQYYAIQSCNVKVSTLMGLQVIEGSRHLFPTSSSASLLWSPTLPAALSSFFLCQRLQTWRRLPIHAQGCPAIIVCCDNCVGRRDPSNIFDVQREHPASIRLLTSNATAC